MLLSVPAVWCTMYSVTGQEIDAEGWVEHGVEFSSYVRVWLVVVGSWY